MLTVTGSAAGPFADAVSAVLRGDTDTGHPESLATLCGNRVFGFVPAASRTVFPYIVLARREAPSDVGAMQREAQRVSLWIDIWTEYKGAYQAHRICARLRTLLQRRALALRGFTLVEGSLICAQEDVDEFSDLDMPDRVIYRGLQHWTAVTEERV